MRTSTVDPPPPRALPPPRRLLMGLTPAANIEWSTPLGASALLSCSARDKSRAVLSSSSRVAWRSCASASVIFASCCSSSSMWEASRLAVPLTLATADRRISVHC